MAAASRCILLAGAPITEDLDWNESRLLPTFDSHFTRILEGRAQERDSVQASFDSTHSSERSKWRSVDLGNADGSRRGRQDETVAQTQFLSFDDDRVSERHEHSKFLEHSMAVFDELASSQILGRPVPDDAGKNTTIDFSTSFATTSATDSSVDISVDLPSRAPELCEDATFTGSISNLKQIPSADYINGIRPQTMTVNLIVGVVTVSPARTVQLKWSNAEMDIIELVVGDDTRAGFTISFWLTPVESQNNPTDDLRHGLSKLRAGDVVLLQNIALSSFRNSVYGQSLSKRFARNSTLVRRIDDSSSAGLPYQAYEKMQRVQAWACDFVGLEKKSLSFAAIGSDSREFADALPPDTQD